MTVLLRELRQLARYGLVGVASNALLYLAFLLLLGLALRPELAAGLCYVLGVALGYGLNRTWTFESRDTHKGDLPKFLFGHLVGLCSAMLVLNLLMAWLRPEIAQIVNIGVTAAIIYVALRLLRFGGARAA